MISSLVELPEKPSDSVSQLQWILLGGRPYIAASSWDSTVRVWSVESSGNIGSLKMRAEAKQLFTQQKPVLSMAASREALYSGGCENNASILDMQTGQSQVIAQHQSPVRYVAFWEENKVLFTAGFDQALYAWDGKTSRPVLSIKLPSKPYAMDLMYPYLAVAVQDNSLLIYDLSSQNVTEPRKIATVIKNQVRVIKLFKDPNKGLGCIIGAAEGRCVVHMFTDQGTFAFKAHRIENDTKATPVNCADLIPNKAWFATGGGDGCRIIWDREKRSRVKTYSDAGSPITDLKFDPSGCVMAWAVSYDWHKGHSVANNYQIKICMAELEAQLR